ncbi:MAG: ABC transporter permease [Cyclobacteriaceae bacterium]
MNMFKATLRMMSRKSKHTILNIVGLTLGIATCLIVGLYVQYEYTFDAFHSKSDRIYRINQSMIWGDWDQQMATTGPGVAIALKTDIQEIEAITRVLKPEGFIVSANSEDKSYNSSLEENLLVVDPEFFNVFSFDMIDGDPLSALSGPYQVVITEELAKKYFGKSSALGKTLYLKGTILESNAQKDPVSVPFTVRGIIENVPGQSHLQFDLVTSASSFSEINENKSTWAWTGFVNYALVREGTNITELTHKLQTIPPKWAASTLQRLFGQSFEELHASQKSWKLFLQPIEEIYLGSQEMGNLLGPVGNVATVRSFSAIGILILMLCSINFMNLSTAQSAERAKEVGIRKVLGAQRKTLVARFLFEAIFMVGLSTLIAVVLTEVLIDGFNQFSGKSLNLTEQLTSPLFIGVIVGFCGLLGLLTGSYPAFLLSSFHPLKSMKGVFSTGFQARQIRNVLVIVQFTITLALIIGTVFIKKQVNYVSQFNLGYDKEHIIQLHNIEHLKADVQLVKNTLINNPAIVEIGLSHQSPPNIYRGDIITGDINNEIRVEPARMKIDGSYLELLDVKLIAGRNFEEDKVTDINGSVILNASAVQALGWGTPDTYSQDSPIGKHISRGRTKMEVIGVTDDFLYRSPKFKVGPLVVYHIDNEYLPDSGTNPSILSIKLNSNSANDRDAIKEIISTIEGDIYALDPFFPMSYSFLDQEFEKSFRQEVQINRIMNAFTAMALIIACLGLYGLAVFSAEQRTKELSIRKILGASVTHLMIIFSNDFTKLVLIGFVLASPIAWYFIDNWLAEFANRTSIDLWVFVSAGFAGVLISWLTIGFQSLSVANRNPVETLKDE